MPHHEYVRLNPEADVAVLFLHGIVGSPRHFDHRLPLIHLVPEQWSVYSVLLPGHGGSVEDFSASTMQHWKSYVWSIFEALRQGHQKVILVGHSMGTLFALQLAIEKGEGIPFLFLLACPLCPQVSFAAIRHSVSLITSNPARLNDAQTAMYQSGSVVLTKKLWKYIPWVPNLLSLLRECRKTRKNMGKLKIKTFVFQSQKDELVSHRSEKYLKTSPYVHLFELKKSTHFFYEEGDKHFVQQNFVDACNEVSR